MPAEVRDVMKAAGSSVKSDKRILTPARREQNRMAQRAYRLRQKAESQRQEVLRRSKPKAGPLVLRPRPHVEGVCVSAHSSVSQTRGDPDKTTRVRTKDAALPVPVPKDAVQEFLTNHTPNEHPSHTLQNCNEFNSRISLVLPIAGQDEALELPLSPSNIIPATATPHHVNAVQQEIPQNLSEPFVSQDDLENSNTAQENSIVFLTNQAESTAALLPALHINTLQLTYTTSLSAIFYNANCLGFDLNLISTADYISPFFNPLASPLDDTSQLIASAVSLNPSMPIHLRPTLPQILFPHHPCIDLLPLPVIRARTIILAVAMADTFNHMEMKQDMYVEHALVYWSRGGSGRPWDMRSWEAAPWFLRKWKLVLGGEEDELWKSSRWWRSIRGLGEL